MNAPANLPALIAALPGDDTRAPQTGFDRARQVEFLAALADCGSARRAARVVGVSHQSAYRARRACRVFARAWSAALLAARARVEDVLADRALDGVEEAVFYHGEVVATRRRYDTRLLLAHLARLDKLAGQPEVAAQADDFDATLDAFARGETPEMAGDMAGDTPAGAQGGAGEGAAAAHPAAQAAGQGDGEEDFSSPGQCNKRSMSPPDDGPYADWRPVISVEDYTALALWAPMRREGLRFGAEWCAYVRAMLYARPDYAPPFEALLGSWDHNGNYADLRACIENQVNAYATHDGKWWLLDQWNMIREDIEDEWLNSELAADMAEEEGGEAGDGAAEGGALLLAQ